ncbi:hypothetical protein [Halalkalicoccus jeotgali]|uniref:hypothetical protein n=1 Tax=Halalkalicoccus jeotgali TaxID=413810 RepID=UPI0009DAA37E|nr:hypothetical protein [Halalkalicoccus jeotgali]
MSIAVPSESAQPSIAPLSMIEPNSSIPLSITAASSSGRHSARSARTRVRSNTSVVRPESAPSKPSSTPAISREKRSQALWREMSVTLVDSTRVSTPVSSRNASAACRAPSAAIARTKSSESVSTRIYAGTTSSMAWRTLGFWNGLVM